MESLDTHCMRYLREAVSLGTVRAAAAAMNVAPSAVTRHIAKLETELGVPLLERHRRGIKPTDAGLLLLDYYREYLANEEALISKFHEIHGLQRGNVSLVVVQGFVDDVMQNALREFSEHHPGLTVSLRTGGNSEILALVEQDEVHIGLTHMPISQSMPPRIRSRACMRQPICLITRPDHPLARRRRKVQVQDLQKHPIIMAGPAFGTRQVMQLIEAVEDIRFNIVFEADNLIAMKSFVRTGLGITLLPAYSVMDEVITGTLVAVPIEHQLLQAVDAHVVTRLGRELPVGANHLLRLIAGRMRAFQQPGGGALR